MFLPRSGRHGLEVATREERPERHSGPSGADPEAAPAHPGRSLCRSMFRVVFSHMLQFCDVNVLFLMAHMLKLIIAV